jgi:Recombination endonuclease VII
MQTFAKKCLRCDAAYLGTARNQKYCPSCGIVRTRERRHDRWVANPRRQLHGLSQQRYDELKALGCAICSQSFAETPHIDHDHEHCPGKFGCKECVRGLLCRFCNNGFAYAIEKNPSLRELVAAPVLEYLDKFKRKLVQNSSS